MHNDADKKAPSIAVNPVVATTSCCMIPIVPMGPRAGVQTAAIHLAGFLGDIFGSWHWSGRTSRPPRADKP
jgi:hypothetical protein